MKFDLARAVEILSRTPTVLEELLSGLDEAWIVNNEGPDTWSPFDVIGHLIHGEKTDWMGRATTILNYGETLIFEPFDRFAQFQASQDRTLAELLEEFALLRRSNLERLEGLELRPEDLGRTGKHPDFGVVTLEQLLATWVVHDLGHLAQITRVMAKQYGESVGPWVEYLPVLSPRERSS